MSLRVPCRTIGRVNVRAHTQRTLGMRNPPSCVYSQRRWNTHQDYETEENGRTAGYRGRGARENSGPDTKREFKASSSATTRLITCFLPRYCTANLHLVCSSSGSGVNAPAVQCRLGTAYKQAIAFDSESPVPTSGNILHEEGCVTPLDRRGSRDK